MRDGLREPGRPAGASQARLVSADRLLEAAFRALDGLVRWLAFAAPPALCGVRAICLGGSLTLAYSLGGQIVPEREPGLRLWLAGALGVQVGTAIAATGALVGARACPASFDGSWPGQRWKPLEIFSRPRPAPPGGLETIFASPCQTHPMPAVSHRGDTHAADHEASGPAGWRWLSCSYWASGRSARDGAPAGGRGHAC